MRGQRPLRLFVAAYPPIHLAHALLDLLGQSGARDMRLTPPEQVHLTLQFIGDTDPRDMEGVQESVRRAVSGLEPPEVGVAGLVSLPERGQARLVAAALEPHPTLLELHRRLALRLAKNAKERSGERFLPHLTLGRYASGGGARIEVESPGLERFRIAEAILVQSVLKPSGAEHRPIGTFPLK